MSLRFFYRENTGDVIEVIDGIDIGGFSVQHCAEEGRVGQGTITISDPLGIYDFSGMRTCYLAETDAIGPIESDTLIWRGYVWPQHISRGESEITGVARVWQLDVVDQNSILSRRFQIGADAKRPAEKDVARIQWLADTAEAGIFDDTTTFVHTDRPTSMSATDYNQQPNLSVIDDCAQQSGKNYWADFLPGLGITLWYGYAGEPDYVASIAISNVASEINEDSIWGPSPDSQLDRDPSRVYSGVGVAGDGFKPIYRQRAATATEFAIRDTMMPAINVKTAAVASRRANRYLEEISTQEERINVSILVLWTHVNRVRPGQWINVHFSHMPGYQTTTPMRVLARTISQPDPWWYKLDLELSGGDALPPPGNGAARLYFPMNRDQGLDLNPDIAFDNTGDDPGFGRAFFPLLGEGLSYHEMTGYEGNVWDGIMVETDGTVDISFRASLAAVATTEIEMVWTVWLDGDVVGTTTVAEFHAGPGFVSQTQTVTVTDLAVTAGQLIHCSIETTGTFLGGYKSPAGVGGPDENLTVTGTFE